MKCKHIQIPICPACKTPGMDPIYCWFYKEFDNLAFKSPKPSKQFLVERLKTLNSWDIRYSSKRKEKAVFYFKEALKCRFPDLYDVIERVELLL